MRPDVDSATERVIALRARLADSPAAGVAPQKIEDELCVGYVCALEADAWLSGVEERLQASFEDSPLDAREEVLALVAEHAKFQRSLIALRRELAGLRREHDRLRGYAPAGASS
jgi:hypothetical protein